MCLSLIVALALYQYFGFNSCIHEFYNLVREEGIQFISNKCDKSYNLEKSQVHEHRVRRNERPFPSGWIGKKADSISVKGQVESIPKIQKRMNKGHRRCSENKAI